MSQLVLRVVEGNATGGELPLDGELLLGRSAGQPGNLGNDATLSRRHARIHEASGGELVLEDLGSHNGTRVNGELIAGPHPLAAGDRIELGETILELVAVAVLVEPDLPAGGEGSREQATRLGQVPVDLPAAGGEGSREQATRLGRVPVDLPAPAEGGWGAHAAPPTRVGRVPEEILAEVRTKDQPTRLGRVPEPGRPAADEQATRLGRVPVEPPAEAPPLGRAPVERPAAAAEEAAGEDQRRPRWWRRIFGGSR
jgi:hypothetical protein